MEFHIIEMPIHCVRMISDYRLNFHQVYAVKPHFRMVVFFLPIDFLAPVQVYKKYYSLTWILEYQVVERY
jgi:hypothetical protein